MSSKLIKHAEGHAYVSSNGRQTLLSDMAYTHLENAIRKIERENPQSEDLPTLRAELESRPAPEE